MMPENLGEWNPQKDSCSPDCTQARLLSAISIWNMAAAFQHVFKLFSTVNQQQRSLYKRNHLFVLVFFDVFWSCFLWHLHIQTWVFGGKKTIGSSLWAPKKTRFASVLENVLAQAMRLGKELTNPPSPGNHWLIREIIPKWWPNYSGEWIILICPVSDVKDGDSLDWLKM